MERVAQALATPEAQPVDTPAVRPPTAQHRAKRIIDDADGDSDDIDVDMRASSAFTCDADATGRPAEECETQHNSNWLAALERGSPAGRKLWDHFNHMAHVSIAGDIPSQCPIDQASTFLRVFVHAFAKTSTPFGLPREQPKCIAMCNLNGEKNIYYSNHPALIFMLAITPTRMGSPEAARIHVRKLWEYARAQPNRSLLMTYSLPFQVSIDHLHWEVRTVERTAAGAVMDGHLAFRVGEDGPSTAASAAALEAAIAQPVLQHQYQALKAEVVAQDTDIDPLSDASSIEGIVSDRVAVLEHLVNAVRGKAKEAESGHRQEVARFQKDIQALQAREVTMGALAETVVEKASHDEREENHRLRCEQDNLAQAVVEKGKEVAVRDREIAVLKADWEAAKLCWTEERENYDKQIAAAAVATTAAGTIICKANEQLQAEIETLGATNKKTIENLERQKQDAEIARRSAVQDAENEKATVDKVVGQMQALSKKMEGHDAVVESQLAEIADLKRRVARQRIALHVVGAADKQLASGHTMQLAAVRAEVEKELASAQTAMRNARKDLKAKERERATLSANYDRSNGNLADATAQMDRLKTELAKVKVELSAAEELLDGGAAPDAEPPAKPAAASFDPNVPTAATLSLELGAERARVAKLAARVEALEPFETKLAETAQLLEEYKRKHDQAHVELADVRVERETLRSDAQRLKAEAKMGPMPAAKKMGGKGGKSGAAAESTPPFPTTALPVAVAEALSAASDQAKKSSSAAFESLVGQTTSNIGVMADMARRCDDQTRQIADLNATLCAMQFVGYAQPMYAGPYPH